MSKPHSTEDDALSSVTAVHEFSEPPVIGHTYDAEDPAEPVFVIPDGPQVGAAELASGHIDVRCAKPGRRGCKSRMAVSREPGKPPLIVIEHEQDCPWLAVNLTLAVAAALAAAGR